MPDIKLNPEFFDFIVRKEIPYESLEEDFHNFSGEDSFNSDVAEKALEIAFSLYPDESSDNEDDLMDKRHEFVNEFLEYARCLVVKTWAENLGMVTIEKAQENANAQTAFAVKVYKDRLELQAENFRNMSSYQFSKWKLEQTNHHKMENPNPFGPMPAEDHEITMTESTGKVVTKRVPQDSEDEAWEQMVAFQRANFNHYQDI